MIESGDAREVHHLALLIGYGAGAVNPYLAFETLDDMIRDGRCCRASTHEKAVKNYIKALNKGVLKVMSKMGISTLQSYRGAQIFEAVGLEKDFVDRYFTWTASRIGGVGIDAIAEEVRARTSWRFRCARWPSATSTRAASTSGGATGNTTSSIPTPSSSCSTRRAAGQYAIYKEYTRAVNDQTRKRATLRGLFELKPAADADPARRGRAGRERSSSGSPPARCRTGRSARKRTRRWPLR